MRTFCILLVALLLAINVSRASEESPRPNPTFQPSPFWQALDLNIAEILDQFQRIIDANNDLRQALDQIERAEKEIKKLERDGIEAIPELSPQNLDQEIERFAQKR